MIKLTEALVYDVLKGDYTTTLISELARNHKLMETCNIEDVKQLQGRVSMINDIMQLKNKATLELKRLKNR